ncbi:extracellular solute-binding protein [Halopenitus persicus]|uniref:extracellular solute-binding protein n=1 Tax=Halopenitus persicus TaxID=1048396 RepID=UPI0012FE6332|nr:extracellular solute-binding protein [Halopenitus persicus]
MQATSGIAAAAIAGCLGDGGGGSGGNGNGGSGGNGNGGSDGTNGGSGGATIEFWDVMNAQSRSARDQINNISDQFEQDTGNQIDINFSGYAQLSGAKWFSSFERGDYPHVFSGESIFTGRFAEQGWVKPFDEWKDALDDETLDNIQWFLDIYRETGNTWKDDVGLEHRVHALPVGLVTQEPFQVRTDHMEEAGLDPDQDFPPESYDDLLDLALELKNNGPSDYGFQVHGDVFDWYTYILPAAAASGRYGYFADDFKSVNFDTEEFIQRTREAVGFFREHEVSNPGTPQMSDEEAVGLLINGEISMSVCEPPNFPEFLDRGQSQIEQGNIQYGKFFDTDDGFGVVPLSFCLGLTNKPDDVDQAKWDRQMEAAKEYISMWFSKDFQKFMFSELGMLPIREDVWAEVQESLEYESQHQAFETMTTMAKNSVQDKSSFPLVGTIEQNVMGPRFQEALNGEITPEECCNRAAEEANQLIDEFWAERE